MKCQIDTSDPEALKRLEGELDMTLQTVRHALSRQSRRPRMKCPNCGTEINAAALMGAATSKAKAAASRANGKLGGAPKGKRKKRTKGMNYDNSKV